MFEDEAVSKTLETEPTPDSSSKRKGKPNAGISDLWAMMDQKATKNELEEIRQSKANRVDAEMSIRGIEYIHKMVYQVCLLLTQKFKLSIEKADTIES